MIRANRFSLVCFWMVAGWFGLADGLAQTNGAGALADRTVQEPADSPVSTRVRDEQPEWFEAGWRKLGEVELIGVSVEGQATAALAERELLEKLRRAILEQLGFERPEDPQVLPELSRRFIREQLLVSDHLSLSPYQDELTAEAARIEGKQPVPYYLGYAEARLTPPLRELVERWKKLPALRDSLRWVGVGSFGVLAAVAILFGYLKVDHLTHSHYTRRLQTAALLSLAFLVGLVAWLFSI